MPKTEGKVDLPEIFANEPKKEEVKPSEEDLLLAKMIEVYEEKEWYGYGWSNGNMVCILESANVARYGAKKGSTSGIKKAVVERIHRAIFPDRDTTKMPKSIMAASIMGWNDGGTAEQAGGKDEVIRVLKKALKLGKKEKK